MVEPNLQVLNNVSHVPGNLHAVLPVQQLLLHLQKLEKNPNPVEECRVQSSV